MFGAGFHGVGGKLAFTNTSSAFCAIVDFAAKHLACTADPSEAKPEYVM